MMRWNFPMGRLRSELSCSKARKRRCFSFRRNLLQRPKSKPKNGFRTFDSRTGKGFLQAAFPQRRPLFLAGLLYESQSVENAREFTVRVSRSAKCPCFGHFFAIVL